MGKPGDVHHAQTFRPRIAPVMAALWYAIAALGGYDLVSRGDSREIAIGLSSLALVTVVVYAIAQRPAIVADAKGVLLRNVVRDVWLPWHLVKGIETKWSLAIETEAATYGSWAMTGGGAARPRRHRTVGMSSRVSPAPAPAHEVTWTVPDLLEQLRRRGLHGERTGSVEVRPAWPVIGAFVVTTVALAAVLVIPVG